MNSDNLPECKWTANKVDDDFGFWKTDCGEAYVVNVGTPSDNKMNFCCYCGGKIKEVINE